MTPALTPLLLRRPLTGQPVLHAAGRESALDLVRSRGHSGRGVMGVGVVQGPALPFPLVAGQQRGNCECAAPPRLLLYGTQPCSCALLSDRISARLQYHRL